MYENWSRPFRYMMLTGLVLVLIGLLWYVRAVFSPLIIAALLAYILSPVVDYLSRFSKLSHSLVVTIAILIVIIILSVTIAIVAPPLIDQIQLLSVELNDFFNSIQKFILQPIVFLNQEIQLGQYIPDLAKLFSESIASISKNAIQLVESTTKNMIWFLVIVVATYYLLLDWQKLYDWLLNLVPVAYQADIQRLYLEVGHVWRGYLRGNLTLMLIVGVAFTLVYIAIGMPGALVLGLLAGLLTIIPDLGPAIAIGIAVIVALFEGSTYLPISNFWFAILVIGIYLGLINVKNIWIRPRIFGRSVHMHEGVVFIAIMVAVVLEGILGALIVIPVLGSAGVIGHYLYRKTLGVNPWPEDELVKEKNEKEHTNDESVDKPTIIVQD